MMWLCSFILELLRIFYRSKSWEAPSARYASIVPEGASREAVLQPRLGPSLAIRGSTG